MPIAVALFVLGGPATELVRSLAFWRTRQDSVIIADTNVLRMA